MAGAYGNAYDAEWDSDAVALLDRGFIYAIAGVRGGGELGQFWYEDGRGMTKNHTFADTVAAARHLIAARPAAPHTISLNLPIACVFYSGAPKCSPAERALVGAVQPLSIPCRRSLPVTAAAQTLFRTGSGVCTDMMQCGVTPCARHVHSL